MKKFLKTAVVLSVLMAVAIAWLKNSVDTFMDTPMVLPDEGLRLQIEPGNAFAAVSRRLVDDGAIDDDRWFRLYARYTDKAGDIHAGTYRLSAGTTPRQALQQFTSGNVQLFPVTLIEGWNVREMLAALQSNEAIVTTLSDEDWPAFLGALNAVTTHPEGLFLPETYRVPHGTTDAELLRQAYELMQSVLAEEWQARSEASGVQSPYEALILASIIEKETGRADERATISGVFTRRLELGMRLQTDPTVIYGIGAEYDGDLTRAHLRTDTPYNTYTRHGLPPTPIAMPGRDAIHAALHPQPGKALYFVATGLGDGGHRFSETKAEHDKAVAEYLRQLRRNRQSEGS